MIVIGAGLAGLAAAQQLEQAKVNYLVLEGSDRTGGRVHSIDWNGATIELGAQWITGCVSSNILYKLGVEDLGLKGIQNESYNYIDCQTGLNITEKANERLDEFEEIYENMTNAAVKEF